MLSTFSTLLIMSSVVTLVQSECPNGCSQHGDCGPRDQCACYKNYQSNDCSERVCPFGNAHVDTPKGDLNMDGTIHFNDGIENHQVYPNKVSELWNVGGEGSKGHAEEAHYYMECSNAGLCDRSSGTCSCFDGFEGSACHRTTCPNACSGHGTCESLKDLSNMANGTALSYQQDQSGTFDYDLWDGRFYFGCKCDPWYFGHDCAQRRCPVGIDPMYKAGSEPREETIQVHVAYAVSAYNTDTWFRIRVFDYWGDSFVTTKIVYSDTPATLATNIELALEALPNKVVDNVLCKEAVNTTYIPIYRDSGQNADAAKHDNVYCRFLTNAGAMRLPEVESSYRKDTGNVEVTTWSNSEGIYILPTPYAGEDKDLAPLPFHNTTDGTLYLNLDDSTTTQDTTNSAGDAKAHGLTHADPKLIKIGQLYVVGTFSSTDDFTPAYKVPYDLINLPFTVSSITVSPLTTDDESKIDTWNLGSTIFTAKDDPTTSGGIFVPGAAFFFHNIIYTVVEVLPNPSTDKKVRVDRPFAGKSGADTAVSIASTAEGVYPLGTNAASYDYVFECSNRGLCNRDTGMCECHAGYYTSNCDNQSPLAT